MPTHNVTTTEETSSGESSRHFDAPDKNTSGRVTLRSFFVGLVLSAALAALCVWISTVPSVHFLGGVQMPAGAIFALLFLILAVNLPLRALNRRMASTRRVLPPFSPVELLTIYSMLLFAALVSTPGCDNFFLTAGPTLFYFSSRENGWSDLFYSHVPRWFAPGWNGKTVQREVIEKLYTGNVAPGDIRWREWSEMLVAWSILLLLIYGALFFLSLLLRRQWIEREALAFPLVQLPLQMVEVDAASAHPPARAFWGNRLMWMGFGIAAVAHILRGMQTYYPDWPVVTGFQGNEVAITFTERPWTAVGAIRVSFFFSAIGIAYLLTREVSFSFWVFFLLQAYAKVMAEQLGYPVAALPRDSYTSQPTFIAFQSVGGWLMLGAILLWTARHHLALLAREAFGRNAPQPGDPFAPRFAVFGFLLSCAGIIAWCLFAGISVWATLLFFGIYFTISLVLARLVIEGGFLFPQVTFAPLDMMATGLVGARALGPETITKLSFVQPMTMSDMRTNLLPGFLHTLKIGHELRLETRQLRRLMMSIVCAIIVSLAVTVFVSIVTLYRNGGLTGYTWFTYMGPQSVFNAAAATIKNPVAADPQNMAWMSVGGLSVLAMTLARARFAWFPLHPLGYIVATGYPITRLWPSFFLGWAIKSLLLRFGGSSAVVAFRPFMIGLIFGNITAMILWMIIGYFKGIYIPFWAA